MSRLRIVVNKGYCFLNDLLPILLHEVDNTFLHNKRQVEILNIKSRNTFEGQLACGASCYLMKYFLERHGISTYTMYSNQGYGKYIDDHCFLVHKHKNSEYIIDPTYRQMFSGQSFDSDNYLFQELPWAFVGRYNKLEDISNKLYRIDKTFSDDNMYFWKHSIKIVDTYPLSVLMENENVVSKDCFQKLYYEIKEKEKFYFE